MIERWMKMNDGHEIFIREWNSGTAQTLVIAHGMAEHSLRYQHFAQFLNEHGYNVLAMDLRGHGRTSEKNGQRGYIQESNGWQRLMMDLETIINSVDGQVHLFGHSMGAILASSASSNCKVNLQSLVLSAHANHPGMLLTAGKIMSRTLGTLSKCSRESSIMDSLTFGEFNKPFKPNRTKFDWLSRDHAQVDRYISDPDCGEMFSHQFFHDLLTGVGISFSSLKKPGLSCPTLILSGSDDPVVGFEKGFKNTVKRFETSGRKYNQTVKNHSFKSSRHEILNEINRDQVYQFILTYLNEKSA